MGFVLWITGLPCSGKTTLANSIADSIKEKDIPIVLLDGDDIRSSISSDLDYTYNARNENVRRVASISKLLIEQGVSSIVSILSPLEIQRNNAKKIIGDRFNLVYLNTSIETCEKRDVKGMYKLARENKIKNFTGVSSTFEEPQNSNIKLDTSCFNVYESTDIILEYMNNNFLINTNGSKYEKPFETNKK